MLAKTGNPDELLFFGQSIPDKRKISNFYLALIPFVNLQWFMLMHSLM